MASRQTLGLGPLLPLLPRPGLSGRALLLRPGRRPWAGAAETVSQHQPQPTGQLNSPCSLGQRVPVTVLSLGPVDSSCREHSAGAGSVPPAGVQGVSADCGLLG